MSRLSAVSLAAVSLAVVPRAATLGQPATRGRLVAAIACLVVLTAACSTPSEPAVEIPQGRQFIPMVPDSIDDVGLAPSVAVDGEGLPNISYFGFTATLQEGEIPVARPVGSPFLQTEDGEDAGAVLLASLTPEQIWNRGAVAQPRESPAGVPVPFGPAAEPSLATLTPSRAKGTDIAITGTDIHAAWTADTGVWYGLGPSFEIEAVEETRDAGAPSIVVDGSGAPIVAYTVAGARPEVRVAERVGARWQVTSVTTLSACGDGCPPATHVALLGEELLVVVADPLSGELIAAQRQGDTWVTEVVATDVTGGASVATAGDSATISFYTGSGLEVVTGRFGSWSEVASLGSGAAAGATGEGTSASSGVAVDDAGTVWVSWEDGEGIHLASGADGEELEEIELPDTTGGVTPTVAITEDGSFVYLAWYDTVNADLRLGTYAEVPDLLIAAPSPPPQAPEPPAGGGDCGQDGQLAQDIVAVGSTFDPQCLVAPAGEPFAINFDNQDPIVHNLVVATDEAAIATDPIFPGPDVPGPDQVALDVPPIDAGDYFFLCTYHPATMTGALAVIEAAGGGGGDSGGGG